MSDSDSGSELRNKAREIAGTLRALPSEKRSQRLEQECSGDAELRAAVEDILSGGAESLTLERDPRAPLPSEPYSDLPEQLGPYRVVRKLGSGGMGVVYEAKDTRLGRKVAIKLLPDSRIFHERSHQRFLQEARVASSLDHPNICSIYDIGTTDDDESYIVMAYYDGETLEQKLAHGPLSVDAARDIAIQVARGLARAHAAGITHRDIKPANVIVTHDGEVKLLDFGLAKLAGAASLTRPGAMPGTLSYMSPEQVKGQRDIDGRADIFALGAVLYEMLTCKRPFYGESPTEIMAAIAQAPAEPLNLSRSDVPESMQRVIDRALAKERSRRYQSVTEMLADLESGAAPTSKPSDERARPNRWVLASAIAAVAVVVGWLAFNDPPGPIDTTRVEAERPSLAVLRFQNLTGNAELAWLRNGLAEMLVTELSQSPEIAVTSTARMYEGLRDHDMLEEPAPSFEQIRALARDLDAGSVVRGSYALVGNLFRIAMTIEDAARGDIIASDRVDGEGAESVFLLVDRISATIRGQYRISRPREGPATVAAATTSSLEAWRLYTEGLALANEFKSTEAIVMLDRAVQIDPDFAMALADLGAIHSQLGHQQQADEYLQRALALTDRLPVDQRFEVEGIYYADSWSTLGRAIDIYEEGLTKYPDKDEWRNNLARRYAFHERYEDAIDEFEIIIDSGSEFTGDFFDAANANAALDRMDLGYELLSEVSSRDEWFAQYVIGWYLTEWRRLDDAEERFQAAAELRLGEWTIPYARWRIAVLDENWPAAEAYAREVATSSEPQARWRAEVSLARNAVYRGSAEDALQHFEAAATSYPSPNAYTALARCWKAELLLELGRPADALSEAEEARESGASEFPELKSRFVAALAHEALGQSDRADALVAELETSWAEHSRNQVEERQLELLRGRLALSRGESEVGLDAMRRAAALLPPRGVEFHWHVYPNHAPVWAALGEAELAAGESDNARLAFERIAESGSEHLERPLAFVRSFYFLARLELERGEPERARHYFERFLSFWASGELDPERVREAVETIGG